MMILEISKYEEGALLRTLGLRLHDARFDPTTERVVMEFDDPNGAGALALREHRLGGVAVNSEAFSAALGWIKTRIFEARRAAQKEQPGGNRVGQGARP